MPLQQEGLNRLLRCTDHEYRYFQTIDAEHHHIHLGEEWQYDHLFTTVASDGYARMRIHNNGDKELHSQFFSSTEAKAYIKTYVGTTYTNDGALQTQWNRITREVPPSTALVYTAPTIAVLGTMHVNDMTGSGQGSGQVGGTSGDRVEFVLGPDEELLIEVQNKSSTAKDIVISARWYEVGEA